MKNGIDVARLIAENPTNMIILLGGHAGIRWIIRDRLVKRAGLEELRMQRAFISCSEFSMERGMTEVHLPGAQLKRKAIASAQQVLALAGSNKLSKEELTSFASIDQIDHLFTDDGLSEEWRAHLIQVGIPFTICAEDGVVVT